MCPRSTLGTISKCQPWKDSKDQRMSEKSHATKLQPQKLSKDQRISEKSHATKQQPQKLSKVRSISEMSDATKQLPSSCRIHTIEGYAFAGSEHISMLVINDNPIKVQFVPN